MNEQYTAVELHLSTLSSREKIFIHHKTNVLEKYQKVDAYKGDDIICLIEEYEHVYMYSDEFLSAHVFRGTEDLGCFGIKMHKDVPRIERHPALSSAFHAAGGEKQIMKFLSFGFDEKEDLCLAMFSLDRRNGISPHTFLIMSKTSQPSSTKRV